MDDVNARRTGRQLNVTVLTSAHPVADNRVHWREAVSLAEAGHDVTLIGVEDPGRIDPRTTPVKVVQMPRRTRSERVTLGTVGTLVEGLKTRADVYHLHDPELVWTIPILKASGAKVVYDAHEDLPAQVLGKEYIPRALRPLASAVAKGLVALAGSATQVVAATETIASRFDPARVTVVKNYPRIDGEAAPAGWLSRQPRAVYVGGMSEARGLRELVKATSCSEFPEGWRVSLAGPVADTLIAEVSRFPEWSRVDYAGVLSPNEARALVRRARVGIVTFHPQQAHFDALPTKMFEYLAEGTPVVASDFPLWRSIVEKFDCGVLVDPQSPREIAEAVGYYATHQDVWERHSANAQEAVRAHLNWRSQEEQLLHVYQKLLS